VGLGLRMRRANFGVGQEVGRGGALDRVEGGAWDKGGEIGVWLWTEIGLSLCQC